MNLQEYRVTLAQDPTPKQLQLLRAGTVIEGTHVVPKVVKIRQSCQQPTSAAAPAAGSGVHPGSGGSSSSSGGSSQRGSSGGSSRVEATGRCVLQLDVSEGKKHEVREGFWAGSLDPERLCCATRLASVSAACQVVRPTLALLCSRSHLGIHHMLLCVCAAGPVAGGFYWTGAAAAQACAGRGLCHACGPEARPVHVSVAVSENAHTYSKRVGSCVTPAAIVGGEADALGICGVSQESAHPDVCCAGTCACCRDLSPAMRATVFKSPSK